MYSKNLLNGIVNIFKKIIYMKQKSPYNSFCNCVEKVTVILSDIAHALSIFMRFCYLVAVNEVNSVNE